jgi:hypothetical protein
MWNALRVLLHRPLLSDGELQTNFPRTSKSSFAACSEAAINIVEIVRLYDKAFSVRRAPYLISYATYVAATVHVRIAATQQSNSQAHDCLRACFFVMDQNSETNYAVRKASMVVEALCKRMGLSEWMRGGRAREAPTEREQAQQLFSPEHHSGGNLTDHTNSTPRSRSHMNNTFPTGSDEQLMPALDVDAIIHNFMQDQQSQLPTMGVAQYPVYTGQTPFNHSGGMENINADVDGTMEYPMLEDAIFGFNASAFDWLYPNTMAS